MKVLEFVKGHRQISYVLCILLLWVVTYLPSLGIPSVSHNECRRILPAITMVDTGNWAVPFLCGKPYFRKPPLMNWIIAASYKLTGRHDPAITRLPTTLIVLGFAFMLFLMPSSILSVEARFVSSCVFLTTSGMALLGRTANIDPNYTCFTGAAILLWLQAWGIGLTGWKKWVAPAIPLGLGILLKGPLILFFYYVLVIIILTSEQKKTELLSVPHLCALLLSTIPFLVWSYYAKETYAHTRYHVGMNKVWIHEMMYRFSFNKISFSLWMRRVLGGIAQFLPWLPGIFLEWNKNVLTKLTEKQSTFIRCSRIAILSSFIAVCALPLTKARYSLPLLTLFSTMTGLLLVNLSVETGWFQIIKRTIFKLTSAALVSTGLLLIICLFSRTDIGITSCRASALQKVFGSSSHGSFYQQMILVTVVTLLFFFFKKYMHHLKASFQLAVSFSAITSVFFASYFVFILPATSKFKYHYSEMGQSIDEFCSDEEPLFMVGLGEEPIGAYVHHKWLMKAGFLSLKIPVKYILIPKNHLKSLDRYLRRYSLYIVTSKNLILKSHRYILAKLEHKS